MAAAATTQAAHQDLQLALNGETLWAVTAFDRASPQTTVEDLVRGSRKKVVPLRRSFIQSGARTRPEPGPLAAFVKNGDHRGLDLYLLFLATASHPPHSTRRSAKVWARAMDLESPADLSGTALASRKRRPPQGVAALAKVWARLERRRLIARKRIKRHTEITALREDGSDEPYTYPDGNSAADYYFSLPIAYWTAEDQWYRHLDLPELAVLLIARSRGDDFILPLEQAQRWYGISADTAERGLRGLMKRRLLVMREVRKPAPRAPDGFTLQRHYTLQPPFGPMRRRDSNAPERPHPRGHLED